VGLGLRSIVVFLFSFIQPLQFFRPPLEEGLSYNFEANARKGKEGRALREAAAEEGEEQQRCEEGMQETIIQSHPTAALVGLPPRHPDTPPPYSVSERDGYMTVWIQIYIYVDKYLAMD
jgi:hypothetical protein